ncbi:MAG: hypothetical protein ACHQ53_15480 [Polyangiales bacterium]
MRDLRSCALALLIASCCGCNLLLGIEPLKGTKPGDGGMDGGSNKGDASANHGDGGMDAGKDAGKKPTGKGDAGGSGDASSDAATEAGSTTSEAGAPDTGTGTQDDGGGGPTTITVHGKVIDYFRHAVSAVDVTVGDKTAVTANDGTFDVVGVTTPYDVSMVISVDGERLAWVYQGLTRSDPTLQVYRGLTSRSGEVKINISNVTFPLATSSSSSETIDSDYAGPDGEFELSIDQMATDYSGASWRGPSTTQVAAHALRWNHATSGQSLPTTFVAHDTHPVGLDETSAAMVTFDLNSSPGLTNGMVSGTVTNPTSADRSNQVYVRWDDDAVIQIADDGAATNAFSYVVPALPNAAMVVAATKGYASTPPYAAAYQDALAAGQTGVSLTIPAAPVLALPADGTAGIGSSTTFQWTGSAKVFLFTVDADTTYDTVYVVTTAKQAMIPAPPISAFAANVKLYWWIETHEGFATVDDATGPEGMLDTISTGTIRGPRRGAGTYTESEHRSVTTSP